MRPRSRVIATAGHVDHGKSSLIVRLTGIDPDRFAEEKRRGLTIDLGYAWCTFPSGREVGFVDVPGHERFIANMLAGVGPVPLVLFVVAADEGWKPQSEEHLEILDVLGVAAGVIAVTKRDVVDDETLAIAEDDVREHVAGTALGRAPVVPVSSLTGEGLPDLISALDGMLASAPEPERERARLFVDRVFSIRGAGTVVTGTLSGGCVEVGDEVELLPAGTRSRIRGLQTHKQKEDRACPVSRVAANLAGTERRRLGRGDVMVAPGSWRPASTFDATLRPIRQLEQKGVPPRGAFKVYAGAAEADATIRRAKGSSGESFVRIHMSRPLVLDVGDRFVLREAGRRATVGGGTVLDTDPPVKGFAGERHVRFLMRRDLALREGRPRDDVAALIVEERGAIAAGDVALAAGARPPETTLAGTWCASPAVRAAVHEAVRHGLAEHHRRRPLDEGAPLADVRRWVGAALRRSAAPVERELVDALMDDLAARGEIVRNASTVRLAEHRVALESRSDDVARLLEAVTGAHESLPPSVPELVRGGIPRDVIEAAARAGTVVRLSPDLVVAPALVDRAVALVRSNASTGMTVSAIREALGTSRKFAVPLVEWLDRQGYTRRDGDLRFPRNA